MNLTNDLLTQATRARYNRIAPMYDLMEAMTERRSFSKWRQVLWSRVRGPRVLEVGVGTGKNIPYYPKTAQVTAIDLSPGMLERARAKAAKDGYAVDLRLMDAQHLDFLDATFDTVVATFVFCSVPDAIRGLQEVCRVTKPGGQILLLEHMRSSNPIISKIMDLLNPLVVQVMGANINRRTVENAHAAGLTIVRIDDLALGGIVKLIEATP
ncbi:MAG: class I SAM-dependent methyltransferase [Chloroflexi bacterium]|nr:class I SAM-dependent methyltransferase [Chloroflexota bacterium]